MIEANWKDRVPTNPGKIKITTSDGVIRGILERDDAPLEVGTPINKANLETPIGEIRFFNGERSDEKYLLCDGSNVNMADYPQLVPTFTDITRVYSYYPQMIDPTYTYRYGDIYIIKYMPSIELYVAIISGNTSASRDYTARIYTSPDGIHWTNRYTLNGFDDTSIKNRFKNGGIIYIEEFNYYIAYGTKCIMYSTNCINWNVVSNLTSDNEFSKPFYSKKLGKVIFTRYSTSSSSSHYTFYLDSSGNLTYETNSIRIESMYEYNNMFYGTIISDSGSKKIYSSSDAITWTATSFDQNSFNPKRVIELGNACYSTYESSIGKFQNGTAQVLETASTNITAFAKMNNFIIAIASNGDLYKVDGTGITFIRNISKTNVAYAYFLSTTNEVILANDYGSITRLDASSLQTKSNAIDRLYQECTPYVMQVENELIFVQLRDTNYSHNFCVYNNRQITLPNLSSDGKFAYIKAQGGE